MIVPLGLMVPDLGVEARGGAEPVKPNPSPACEAQVQLIGVTRIPSRCVAVVTAEVSNLSGRQPVVFEPDDTWLEESRLQVEDSLLDPDEAGRVNLVIHNPTSETRRLEAGCSIGVAMPCLDSDQSGGAVVGMTASREASGIQVRHLQPECGATVQARKTKLGQMLDIGEGQLASEEVARVRSCVLQAHDVFAVEKGELGSVSEVQHHIKTEDCSPVRQPPRRVPFSLRPEISRMVNEMLQAQVIEESSSPWASPVVLVRKKDGSLRFCVDYRRLNAVTRKDVFPLPRIDDLLDQLGGKRVFSTLDARSGYWLIQMHETSREKTAFVTMDGLYEFRVMPYGLCNAPATFQRLMQRTLAGLGSFAVCMRMTS